MTRIHHHPPARGLAFDGDDGVQVLGGLGDGQAGELWGNYGAQAFPKVEGSQYQAPVQGRHRKR